MRETKKPFKIENPIKFLTSRIKLDNDAVKLVTEVRENNLTDLFGKLKGVSAKELNKIADENGWDN